MLKRRKACGTETLRAKITWHDNKRRTWMNSFSLPRSTLSVLPCLIPAPTSKRHHKELSGEKWNLFARKLRHHEDILRSAGRKSAHKEGKETWLMDLSMISDVFRLLLLTRFSRFSLLYSISRLFLWAKFRLSAIYHRGIFVLGAQWNFAWQLSDSPTKSHCNWFDDLPQHDVVRRCRMRRWNSCLVIREKTAKKCIMWCSK